MSPSLTKKVDIGTRNTCPETQVGVRGGFSLLSFHNSFWGRERAGQCFKQLGERMAQTRDYFPTFLVEGEGLRSLQVSALFWSLKLHKYNFPHLACCQVSHHCLVTGKRRPSET